MRNVAYVMVVMNLYHLGVTVVCVSKGIAEGLEQEDPWGDGWGGAKV